jgi:hypothetical protein
MYWTHEFQVRIFLFICLTNAPDILFSILPKNIQTLNMLLIFKLTCFYRYFFTEINLIHFINQILLGTTRNWLKNTATKNRIDQHNVCLSGTCSNTLNKVLSENILNENTLLKGNISINVTNYVFFTFQRI